MRKESLLIIDMQIGFLRPKRKKDKDDKILIISHILRDFRSNNKHVIYTAARSEGEFPLQISPLENEEVVYKKHDDGFKETDLQKRLNETDLLHVVGCNAEYCVKETVASATNQGLSVVIYTNGILSIQSLEEPINRMVNLWSKNQKIKLSRWQEK